MADVSWLNLHSGSSAKPCRDSPQSNTNLASPSHGMANLFLTTHTKIEAFSLAGHNYHRWLGNGCCFGDGFGCDPFPDFLGLPATFGGSGEEMAQEKPDSGELLKTLAAKL